MPLREIPNQREYEDDYEEGYTQNKDTRMRQEGEQRYQRQIMEQAYMQPMMQQAELRQRQQMQTQARAKKRRRKMLMKAAPYLIGFGTTGGTIGLMFKLIF